MWVQNLASFRPLTVVFVLDLCKRVHPVESAEGGYVNIPDSAPDPYVSYDEISVTGQTQKLIPEN